MEDRLQAFNQQGQLLMYMGGHGQYPGQFKALVGVAIDKQNRVFTTEQFPGRLQMFRYLTDGEAAAEKTRREDEAVKAAERRRAAAAPAPPAEKPAEAAPQKAPATPAPATSPQTQPAPAAPSSRH